MPLMQGQVLNNRYRIVSLLGQGGFGAVYRAWDTTLSHPCAVKENFETSEYAQKQFEQEAIVLAGLRHPNLPRVTDHFFIQGEGQYLVMDFIDGRELTDFITDKYSPTTEKQFLDWIDQLCSALEYLHAQSPPIIHRDVKPQNIIIDKHDQAYLVDFGIFKLYDSNQSTARGARGITPGFSPPEQYGRGKTDALSDEYSLGATLYFALTGVEPVDAIERLVHKKHMPLPSDLAPNIHPHIEPVILKSMNLEAKERYLSIREFSEALTTPRIPVQAQVQTFNQPGVWSTSAASAAAPSVQPRIKPVYKDQQQIPSSIPTFQHKTISKSIPNGVKITGWFNIITGAVVILAGFVLIFPILIGIAGILGGIYLLQEKRIGWWLSQIYLGLGAFSSILGIGIGFTAGSEFSSDEFAVFLLLCGMAVTGMIGIVMIVGMIYLFKQDIRERFI